MLCDNLRNAGVCVTPGRGFYAVPPSRAHLRLSIAFVDETQIEEGCRRLGATLTATAS